MLLYIAQNWTSFKEKLDVQNCTPFKICDINAYVEYFNSPNHRPGLAELEAVGLAFEVNVNVTDGSTTLLEMDIFSCTIYLRYNKTNDLYLPILSVGGVVQFKGNPQRPNESDNKNWANVTHFSLNYFI